MSPNGPVPAIGRAVAILDLLAAGGGRTMSASEIAKDLGLARSSTSNICTELRDHGLLRMVGGHYALGPRLLELGSSYLETVDETQLFYQLCERTRSLSRETARLALLDGMSVVYLARYDGTQPLRLTAGIGDRFPATITATGKAILSTFSAEELAERIVTLSSFPRFTEHSIADADELIAEMDRVRARGYAIDDEETTPDVMCYSIPIAAESGPSSMAVSVTVHKSRDSESLRASLIADLRSVEGGIRHGLRPHVLATAEPV